jgi:hypothetical protein
VSRKRLTASVLALALVVASRAVVAAPQGFVTELRAATCCAEHCPMKPARPLVPNRCCFVGSPAADPASTPAATEMAPPALVLAAASAPAVLVATPLHPVPLDAEYGGPPAYLRSLALRL